MMTQVFSAQKARKKSIKPRPSVEQLGGSTPRLIIFMALQTPVFDYGMGALILFNMIVIIAETDHAAEHDSELAWAELAGWITLILFVIELCLRLYSLQKKFWIDTWNKIDFVIVCSDAVFSLAGLAFGDVFPVSVLRVFRLGKLARVSKVFRIFPELRLMMAGLMGSVRAIFWGAVLLAFALIVWSIVAVQFIHPLNKTLTNNGAHDGCDRCPRAFASVLESVLTFSQQIVAGDSWGQATIPVIENYPLTAFFFTAVFLSVGIAILNLILGIVVNIAQQEHERLKAEMDLMHKLERTDAQERLLALVEDMDKDGDGELSREEIMEGYKEREDFRILCSELDILEEDMPVVFATLDTDKDGSVNFKEFVEQMYKLKDTDTAFTLATIKHYMTTIKDAIVDNTQKSISSVTKQLDRQSVSLGGLSLQEVKNLEEVELDTLQKLEVEDKYVKGDLQEIESEVKVVENQLDGLNELMTERIEEKAGGKSLNGENASSGQQRSSWIDQKLRSSMNTGKVDVTSANFLVADQICKEVLGTVLNASQHNHGDLKGLLQDIKTSLELNSSTTSRLLSELMLQRPKDEMVPRESREAPSRVLSLTSCCRHNSPIVTTLLAAPEDPAPDIPLSSQNRIKGIE